MAICHAGTQMAVHWASVGMEGRVDGWTGDLMEPRSAGWVTGSLIGSL